MVETQVSFNIHFLKTAHSFPVLGLHLGGLSLCVCPAAPMVLRSCCLPTLQPFGNGPRSPCFLSDLDYVQVLLSLGSMLASAGLQATAHHKQTLPFSLSPLETLFPPLSCPILSTAPLTGWEAPPFPLAPLVLLIYFLCTDGV